MKIMVVSKDRLSQMAGISSRTLSRYINSGQIYERLVEETGYRKSQKILKPDQVSIIVDYFVFDLDTENVK